MFNILVTADYGAWEGETFSFERSRFKEYSGFQAEAISLNEPETLRNLEGIPTLLMYETWREGVNARLVRHGTLRNIRLHNTEISFEFIADPNKGYTTLGYVQEYADRLDLHRFELTRTHWAVKNGSIPLEFLAHASPTIPEQTPASLITQIVQARNSGDETTARSITDDFLVLPPSIEKTIAQIKGMKVDDIPPAYLPFSDIRPRSQEALRVVNRCYGASCQNPSIRDCFELAWLLERYATPAEAATLDQLVSEAKEALYTKRTALTQPTPPGLMSLAYALWQCINSNVLRQRLNRELSVFIDYIAERQSSNGDWEGNVKITSLIALVMQRLGHAKHQEMVEKAIAWLFTKNLALGGWAEGTTGVGDPFATVLALEVLRRSKHSSQLQSLFDETEEWLIQSQGQTGFWHERQINQDPTTATILRYFENSGAILSQVDGYLLMSRDFYRRACDLEYEGGINNHRLAAIAAVHAIEMFLYGLFESREDLGVLSFINDSSRTLGTRQALAELQTALEAAGRITPPKQLLCRNQISSLVGKRDVIIHCAHEISSAELNAGLRAVKLFIDEYGASLLNKDILQ